MTEPISDAELAALEAQSRLVSTLFDAIAHGDDEHRRWLKQAIEDHFAGRPIAYPTGRNSAEVIASQAGEIAELQKYCSEWEKEVDRWRWAFTLAAEPVVDNWEHNVTAKQAGQRMDAILEMLLGLIDRQAEEIERYRKVVEAAQDVLATHDGHVFPHPTGGLTDALLK